MEINKITNKIDLIASRHNIIKEFDKKYTIADFLKSLDKLYKLNLSNNEENITLQSLQSIKTPTEPLMETFVNHLENKLYLEDGVEIDNILNSIINCLNSESTEVKKKCAIKIKNIIKENYLKSNVKSKLQLLIDLIINSK